MSKSPNMQDIVITREYDYPVELVWKAWTDPTLVMKWWGPAHYTSPRCVIDFREGGKYVFAMRAPETHGGTESYSAGVYKKIVPMQRLEFNQYLSDRDGNAIDPVQVGVPADFPKNIEFIIEFIAKGEQTELKITEYGWTAGEMLKYAIMGMNESLDKLAAHIDDFK
ncbi:SRPBCC domain-containing protein [Paenibacillus sp. WQ 127069]|uniref:SRPBCC domain-containing protein n=1 Tax=Paenibacillus baimaensis TaxID=2982185 RepID=A0ABT2UC37_9BACL|nr:SRPBCC domain-containing protein [Paenibacillus sp. WQ 127069]MCU6792198.1 SRPBCC domain-containing protein [Paenibacillus sp. WQ 127069]